MAEVVYVVAEDVAAEVATSADKAATVGDGELADTETGAVAEYVVPDVSMYSSCVAEGVVYADADVGALVLCWLVVYTGELVVDTAEVS